MMARSFKNDSLELSVVLFTGRQRYGAVFMQGGLTGGFDYDPTGKIQLTDQFLGCFGLSAPTIGLLRNARGHRLYSRSSVTHHSKR